MIEESSAPTAFGVGGVHCGRALRPSSSAAVRAWAAVVVAALSPSPAAGATPADQLYTTKYLEARCGQFEGAAPNLGYLGCLQVQATALLVEAPAQLPKLEALQADRPIARPDCGSTRVPEVWRWAERVDEAAASAFRVNEFRAESVAMVQSGLERLGLASQEPYAGKLAEMKRVNDRVLTWLPAYAREVAELAGFARALRSDLERLCGPGADPDTIVVPDLAGMEASVAKAWLSEIGLQASVAAGAESAARAGTVEELRPPPGTGLKPGQWVILRVFRAPVLAAPVRLDCMNIPGAVTNDDNTGCDCRAPRQWNVTKTACLSPKSAAQERSNVERPGTTATPGVGGWSCECPRGDLVWSVAFKTCVSRDFDPRTGEGEVAPGAQDPSCADRPGTLLLPDPATGQKVCRCPVGEWSPAARDCVLPEVRPADLDPEDCPGLYAQIKAWRALGDLERARAAAEQARDMGCDRGPIDEAVGPLDEAEDTLEGEGVISSRIAQVCIVDFNDELDDAYDLYANDVLIGPVRNPEGGVTCHRAVLHGGANHLQLRLVENRHNGTRLRIDINDGEYSHEFTGTHHHSWTIRVR